MGFIRNKLYDFKILKSHSFNLPLICIGNLSYGGTGKTPHVEYLLRLLSSHINPATLSRGYKRKSKGFVFATKDSLSSEIGDEPKQLKNKFPKITVAVCENRRLGVKGILENNTETDCIILDDAFQHRSLKSGLNILLTDYNKLYTRDYVLPSGTLREFRCGAKRADIIVVTKCTKSLTNEEKSEIISEIKSEKYQHIFFSFIEYGSLTPMNDTVFNGDISSVESVLLFTGVANAKPLEQYLKSKADSLHSICFGDHHQYSVRDLAKIRENFNNIASPNKIIVTTEKDAIRIESLEQKAIFSGLPIFFLPIQVDFFQSDKEIFNKLICDYARADRKN
jgi:tetraacyldisaccharide 4'-kinase